MMVAARNRIITMLFLLRGFSLGHECDCECETKRTGRKRRNRTRGNVGLPDRQIQPRTSERTRAIKCVFLQNIYDRIRRWTHVERTERVEATASVVYLKMIEHTFRRRDQREEFVVEVHGCNVGGSTVDDKKCDSLIFIFRFIDDKRSVAEGIGVEAMASSRMVAVLSRQQQKQKQKREKN